MGGKYTKKGKGIKNIVNKSNHIAKHVTMVEIAKAAGVQPCTIQQNVNILMKYVLPEMKK